MPKLTVLLPAYNAEKYIKDAIQSILDQTFSDFYLIVADDKSTDGTRAIIDQFKDKRIITYHNSKNLGKCNTINSLYKDVKTEYFTVHDADDISIQTRFEKQIDLLESNKELAMCGCSLRKISESGKALNYTKLKTSDYQQILKNIYRFNSEGDATLIIKTNVIKKAGNLVYRPFFTNSEDYDLSLRIAEKFKTSNVEEVLYLYRANPNSITLSRNYFLSDTKTEICKAFARERIEKGTDSLFEGNWEKITQIENELIMPYKKNPSLFYIKKAEHFRSYGALKKALLFNIKAIIIEPLLFNNWRSLRFTILRSINVV